MGVECHQHYSWREKTGISCAGYTGCRTIAEDTGDQVRAWRGNEQSSPGQAVFSSSPLIPCLKFRIPCPREDPICGNLPAPKTIITSIRTMSNSWVPIPNIYSLLLSDVGGRQSEYRTALTCGSGWISPNFSSRKFSADRDTGRGAVLIYRPWPVSKSMRKKSLDRQGDLF